ncbi:MAG TPA: PQQ-binding-like beta-propeller repeat protein [Stellaceae bacterium]|nr:PQQ-binding-like beta-propeller repeat protein [Stellaceae bacterium]
MKRSIWCVMFGLSLLLSGCDTASDWMDSMLGGSHKTPLPGKRVDVLTQDRTIQADPTLRQQAVRLPRPEANSEWPESGGFPDHAMQHLALAGSLQQLWSVGIGEGASRYGRITSQPVVAAGRVYGLDGQDTVFAVDAQSGAKLWQVDTKPEPERDEAFGGGVAFAKNRLYVTTGYGLVFALDPATGKQIWKHQGEAPFHGAPTVIDGRVLAVNVDNQLIALDAANGQQLWTHTGLPEGADILGTPAPAVAGDTVVVAYSSGELFALRLENGHSEWTDNLATAQPMGALSSLADIHGRPVIDRGRVFAVSHSGRMVSIDLRTGDRVWEQDIGGTQGPWVAGDYVYVLSNDVSLLCLTWKDGKVRWATDLPRYENPDKKRDPIRWAGPILAGDRLIVMASNGEAFSVSPYTGKPLGTTDFPDGVFVDPVVANNTLYVLTDAGELIAMR